MHMREILRVAPVIPVRMIERLEHAVPLARALSAGGLCVLEVTMRTPVALAAKTVSFPVLPGVMTPAEVIAARPHGFTALKLFAAKQAGGVGMLKPLAWPFADVVFCPTGGVSLETAPEFRRWRAGRSPARAAPEPTGATVSGDLLMANS